VLIQAPIRGVRDHLLLLRSLPAFAPIEDGALLLLAEHARVRRVRAGYRLLHPQEPIRHVYLVLEGSVRWSRKGEPHQVAERHQAVGWIALMAREEGVEAVAETSTLVLELPADILEHSLEDHFAITRNLLRLGASYLVDLRSGLPAAAGQAPPAQPGVKRAAKRTLVERVMGMRSAPIFKRASVEAVIALARSWQEVRIAPGDDLWGAGDDATFWVLVEYGRIRCSAGDRHVDVGAGFVLGILDAIGQLPRSYGARAETEVIGSRIDLEGFLGVLETHFDLAREFVAYLARTALDGG